MDLMQIPAQAGQAIASVGPAMDMAQHHAAAAAVVKPMVDLWRGKWGGSIECEPPPWFGPVTASAIGVPVLALIMVGNKIDLTQPQNIALLLFGAISIAMGCAAISSIHSANRPSLMATVAAIPPVPTTVVCHQCGAMVPIDPSAQMTVANNPLAPFPAAAGAAVGPPTTGAGVSPPPAPAAGGI